MALFPVSNTIPINPTVILFYGFGVMYLQLQAAVLHRRFDLILHKAMLELIHVKWKRFGR